MSLSSFWHGNGRWRGHKGMMILGAAGTANAVLKYYWVLFFPLVKENEPVAIKVLYTIFQITFESVLSSGVGLSLDYLRSIYYEMNNSETTPLQRL